MDDLNTFGWLVAMARNAIKKDKKARDIAVQIAKNMVK